MSAADRGDEFSGWLRDEHSWMAAQRREALILGPRLLSLPADQWRAAITEDASYHHVGLLEWILEKVAEAFERLPLRAHELASIATYLADYVPAVPPKTIELRGLAWLRLASALEKLARYAEAIAALDVAVAQYDGLPNGDWHIAKTDYVRAEILRKIQKYDDALAAIDRAIMAFGRYGDRKWFINSQHIRTAILYKQGHCAEPIAILESLVPEVTESGSQAGIGRIYVNLANAYFSAAKYDEARSRYIVARQAFRKAGLITEELKVAWRLSSITARRGDHDSAVAELRAIRREFAALSLANESILVGLEIVESLLALELHDEIVSLARELANDAVDHDLPQQAAHALAYLREAAGRTSLTRGLTRYVRQYIEDLSEYQHLPFMPPETNFG